MPNKWNRQVTEKNSGKIAILANLNLLNFIFSLIFREKTKIARIKIYTSISIDFDPLNPMQPSILPYIAILTS